MLALAALPITARAQTAPETPPPAEPAPPPAAVAEPAPAPAPVVEPAPAAAAPMEAAPPAEVSAAVAAEAPAAAAPPNLPTITGYVEAGYSINFSDTNVGHPVPLRVYDPAGHSFALHAAHLAITHKFTDAISAVIEIDAGRDAAFDTGTAYPSANSPFTAFDVQEAYANYGGGMFTLTAGKFVTYEGIEVIEGPLNPTITRGLLFGWAEPFTHTGVKLHFQPMDAFNIGVGVVNGWDQLTDNNGAKTFIARAAITTPILFAALSGSFGGEQTGENGNPRYSVDLTGSLTLSQAFVLWFQANFGGEKNAAVPDMMTKDASWWGIGLQPVFTAGAFSLGGRLELFDDPDGARTQLALKGKYYNITITPGIKLADAFKIRAEFRVDIANLEVLSKAKKEQYTGALSAEYTF
jgi:hypothetical protein